MYLEAKKFKQVDYQLQFFLLQKNEHSKQGDEQNSLPKNFHSVCVI